MRDQHTTMEWEDIPECDSMDQLSRDLEKLCFTTASSQNLQWDDPEKSLVKIPLSDTPNRRRQSLPQIPVISRGPPLSVNEKERPALGNLLLEDGKETEGELCHCEGRHSDVEDIVGEGQSVEPDQNEMLEYQPFCEQLEINEDGEIGNERKYEDGLLKGQSEGEQGHSDGQNCDTEALSMKCQSIETEQTLNLEQHPV